MSYTKQNPKDDRKELESGIKTRLTEMAGGDDSREAISGIVSQEMESIKRKNMEIHNKTQEVYKRLGQAGLDDNQKRELTVLAFMYLKSQKDAERYDRTGVNENDLRDWIDYQEFMAFLGTGSLMLTKEQASTILPELKKKGLVESLKGDYDKTTYKLTETGMSMALKLFGNGDENIRQ